MQAKRIEKLVNVIHLYKFHILNTELHIAINHCLKGMSRESYFPYVLHVRLFVEGMSKLSEKME